MDRANIPREFDRNIENGVNKLQLVLQLSENRTDDNEFGSGVKAGTHKREGKDPTTLQLWASTVRKLRGSAKESNMYVMQPLNESRQASYRLLHRWGSE